VIILNYAGDAASGFKASCFRRFYRTGLRERHLVLPHRRRSNLERRFLYWGPRDGKLRQCKKSVRLKLYYIVNTIAKLLKDTKIETSLETNDIMRFYSTHLRHCAIRKRVASSISDEVIGVFNWSNPSSRITALRWIQPLNEMSTRIFMEVKNNRHVSLKTSTPSVSRLSSNVWDPRRLISLLASTACYRDSFTFTLEQTDWWKMYIIACCDRKEAYIGQWGGQFYIRCEQILWNVKYNTQWSEYTTYIK
jgi:hypothetical protein